MGNEPKNNPIDSAAEWHIAELVLKITVEGDERNLVQKNLMLIKANSPADAYDKAIILGNEHAMSYQNPHGKQVHIQFIGLSRLNAVYDRLEDGAELLYEEYVGVSDEQIRELVVPKHLLEPFRNVESSRPDYSSAEVLREASKLVEP
ncbi:MAG: DUF4288 domain-containing protein [Candidatus Korobacteraceae bacterium]